MVLLGSDGSGKSTLLELIGPLLERPLFRRQLVFHFRPKVLEADKNVAPVTDPHGKPPRSHTVGFAKLIYYFVDHFAGYFSRVLPAKARNELIIFCRGFDDLLIDPRRYRLHKAGWLAGLLARLLPRADLTFVLDGDPQQLQARKPELSLDEMQRQRTALKRLAESRQQYVLVSGAQPPEEVARVVCCEAIRFLAEREKRRHGK